MKAPELKVIGDIHQCFAHFILRPIVGTVLVDYFQHRNYRFIFAARITEIPVDRLLRYGHPTALQMQ